MTTPFEAAMEAAKVMSISLPDEGGADPRGHLHDVIVHADSKRFWFSNPDGYSHTQTVTIKRPEGADFILMLQALYFSNGTDQHLLKFAVYPELVGDRLSCSAMLADNNYDEPVQIGVTVGVLFFRRLSP